MKQLIIKVQPVMYSYIAVIYDSDTKEQEEVRISSNYEDIVHFALNSNIEEIILCGNKKYTTKIKDFILESQEKVGTQFGYNINIKVILQESK